ncbi:MAG: S1 RNA-binding domain-containing protein [Oscillospiraceae bacterium]|jgi:S1 RNA binding domain protein|nr:S1 RNA-binding domain-containing protein [Oscillospiraceae bacterium]
MQAEVGALMDGKVTGIIEYGAFVDIGDGKTGMVHISEVAQTYVTNIRDHLTVGQEVRVKVLSISDEGKISLSIKKAMDPSPAGNPAPRPERPPVSAAPRPAGGPSRPRPVRRSSPNVWQGQRSSPGGPQSFEDMMTQFKQTSDEKISTLRRGGDTRYSGSSSRRGHK